MKDEKAISPVVGIMLMIAITIVLGVTLIFFATAFEMQEPAPFVAHSSGELVRKEGADEYFEDQIVYIYHNGGDSVKMSEVEIVVDATKCCGMKARLVNLPVSKTESLGNHTLGDDDLIDKSAPNFGKCGGAITKKYFGVGENLWFRINNGKCPLEKGDQITVKIIHTPTNTVIIEETLTAS
jgi:flagellin-like protein